LVSIGLVTLAEIGDKPQLLSLLLAARYRRPVPIIFGILVATALKPRPCGCARFLDHDRDRSAGAALAGWAVLHRNAEMGDKTQVATVELAAKYSSYAAVVTGTTAGMMIANVPAVLLGERVARRMPVRLIHLVVAAIFAAMGILALLGG
jgi:putative Ca2+/H+ antiporter (TMEM165/GDT1 family)